MSTSDFQDSTDRTMKEFPSMEQKYTLGSCTRTGLVVICAERMREPAHIFSIFPVPYTLPNIRLAQVYSAEALAS